MKHYNYSEYKVGTFIEPRWLSVLLYCVLLISMTTVLYILLRSVSDLIFEHEIRFELLVSGLKTSTIAVCILFTFTLLIPWFFKYTRIHKDGSLEMHLSIRQQLGASRTIKISEIKQIDITYHTELLILKRMYVRVITDKFKYELNIKDHNAFIKELRQYNPNIITPELPII